MEKEKKGGETEGPQSGTCSRQKWWWSFLLKSAVSVQTGGEAKKMKPPDSHFFCVSGLYYSSYEFSTALYPTSTQMYID